MRRTLTALTLIGLLGATAGTAGAISSKPVAHQIEQQAQQLAQDLEHSLASNCSHTVRITEHNTIVAVIRCRMLPGR